ncbi:adenosylcobinamide-GDP ribazoletransferase [Streptomyces sp. NBC_01198]|uniref:adenosylcobinamide-GDP ribazoletransferase n=1 Tax=Streptomyces sp. NBC_01198 TaxID=2903769 RepID=UPI002E13197C|nr:adenosylcobinamide-GDP ribazoletransferase [Streptomyces sp. NBC_01198]
MGKLPAASAGDALRFAFGTLTVLPARVTRWDRAAARGGMLAAPLVGGVVGLAAAACGGLLVALGAGPLLAAVGTVAVPAVLTRGLHLDGLADTADGLGSGKAADDALRIMKQSDIGPFGVVTLVFVLLAQVASAAACYAHGWVYGGAAALIAAVSARAALLAACRRGVPAARPGGLGAAVAGTVPPWAALLAAALCAALAAAAGSAFGGLTELRCAAAVACGLAAGEVLVRRCTARFGGVTGDVFGAVTEAAATAALLALSLR